MGLSRFEIAFFLPFGGNRTQHGGFLIGSEPVDFRGEEFDNVSGFGIWACHVFSKRDFDLIRETNWREDYFDTYLRYWSRLSSRAIDSWSFANSLPE